jgi:hypothetical protein
MSLMMESGALPLSFFTHGIWGTAVSRGILVGDIQRLQVPILYECMHLQRKLIKRHCKNASYFILHLRLVPPLVHLGHVVILSQKTFSIRALQIPSSCRHVRSSSGGMAAGSRINVWIHPSLVHPGLPTRGLRLHGSHRRLHGPCRAEDARASPRSSDAPAQLTMHTLHAVAEVSLTDGRIKARA